MSEPRCVHCGHHHYGDIEPDENGTRWCDTAICGDGCCHCACYTPVYRDGPRLVVRQPASEPASEQELAKALADADDCGFKRTEEGDVYVRLADWRSAKLLAAEVRRLAALAAARGDAA